MRSKSSMSSSTPASRAMASRCSTALVEPPVAQTEAIAFSNDCCGDDVARADVAPQHVHRPACRPRTATSSLRGSTAGTRAAAHRRHAQESRSPWPWCWRCTGRRRRRRRGRRRLRGPSAPARVILPAATAPTASNTSSTVTSWPSKMPGGDGAAVEEDAGQVEPGQGHDRAGVGLVAGRRGRRGRRGGGRARPARWSRR